MPAPPRFRFLHGGGAVVTVGDVVVMDDAMVAVADEGIGDVGMTMGFEVELLVVVAAEVVADVEEDDVNVVDILGWLFVCRRVCRRVW